MIQQIIATVFLLIAMATSINIAIRLRTRNDIPRNFTLIASLGWVGFIAVMWIF